MNVWLILFLTVLPAVLIMLYLYLKDKEKKEPKRLIVRALIAGIFATVLAFFAELLFMPYAQAVPDIALSIFAQAFLVAGFIEESSKLLFFRILLWKRKEFNEILDGMVLLAIVGLTFAAVENFLYGLTNGLPTIIIRDLTAVPAHGLITGTMGFFIGIAKIKGKKGNILLGIIVGAFIHGLYDFCAMASNQINFLFFFGVILDIIFSLIVFRKLFKRATAMDMQMFPLK